MPNIIADNTESSSLTQAIGNLARAATVRHGHSTQLTNSLCTPEPPQHTNVPLTQLMADMSADNSGISQSLNTNSSDMKRSQQAVTDTSNSISIHFDGANHVIVRPNRIIRGKVIVNTSERLYVTRIRIKFRAEEVAMVRLEEGAGDNKGGDRLHEKITTFFQVDWKLWGNDAIAYSQAGWDELEAGYYEFPFALKFPNVNYPPSGEEPKGFSIRYIWSSQIDGPALQTGLKSREYLTPYRPIIVTTPDRNWEFKKIVKDRKTTVAFVKANMIRQSYCPDEPFLMHLKVSLAQSDAKIASIVFKFRKHHEGKMLVQKGTAYREHVRVVLQGVLPVHNNDSKYDDDITFNIPTRLVSPSFISNHTRVHYDLQFVIHVEHGSLFKSNQSCEFAIPLTIANLPNNQLLRIPGLTSIEFYRNSKQCPQFFDPSLEEPPEQLGVHSQLMNSIQAVLMTSTPRDDPPNYFSVPNLPPQLDIMRERKEKVVYLTRSAKGSAHGADLTEATIIPGLFDEGW